LGKLWGCVDKKEGPLPISRSMILPTWMSRSRKKLCRRCRFSWKRPRSVPPMRTGFLISPRPRRRRPNFLSARVVREHVDHIRWRDRGDAARHERFALGDRADHLTGRDVYKRDKKRVNNLYRGQSCGADTKNRASRTSKVGGGNATYPKAILAQLYQALFQQLASSTDAQKQQILGLAFTWITNRDVMIYGKNPTFETFANTYGATGEVYQFPQNFNGDYLAIANADINSDKSELYMAQNIIYDASIGNDGTVTDNLIIKRTHNGNQSPYWWYQTTNQDYMQIFVPNGSSLNNQSGGITKSVAPPINYIKNGYSTDPLLLAIASTTRRIFGYPQITSHSEFGRKVFAIWSRTSAGSSSTLSFNYSHNLFTAPAPGVQYQFIFERQSGANGGLSYRGGCAAWLCVRRKRSCQFYLRVHQHAGEIDV